MVESPKNHAAIIIHNAAGSINITLRNALLTVNFIRTQNPLNQA